VSAFLCNLSLSPKGLGELWLKEYLGKRSVVKGSNGHRGTQSPLDRLTARGLKEAKSYVSQILLKEPIVF